MRKGPLRDSGRRKQLGKQVSATRNREGEERELIGTVM